MRYRILPVWMMMLVVSACSSPGLTPFDFKLTPQDTLRRVFDIERFNRNKSMAFGQDYYNYVENGISVEQIRLDAYYLEDIFYPDSLFAERNRYYLSGKMLSKEQLFTQSVFPIGRVIYFDETGSVMDVEDLEEPYLFSLEEVLAFMTSEGIDIRENSTRLWRAQAEGNNLDELPPGTYVWEIEALLPDNRNRRILIDAANGSILRDTVFGEAFALPPKE